MLFNFEKLLMSQKLLVSQMLLTPQVLLMSQVDRYLADLSAQPACTLRHRPE